MTITGTIVEITDSKTIGATQHQRRICAIRIESKYPKDVPFEFWNNNMAQLDSFGVGEQVTIHFDLDGKKHLDFWYASNKAFKIEKA